MSARLRLLTLASVVLGVTPALARAQAAPAQAAPSLPVEGTWTLSGAPASGQRVTVVAPSGDAAFAIGDMGSGWGSTLTFARRADQLVLEYPYFTAYDLMAPLRYTFALSGEETVNTVVIGPETTRLHSRVRLQGDTLLLITRQPVPREVASAGALAEVQRALVVQGDTLRVITTRLGVRGAPTTRVETTYRRAR